MKIFLSSTCYESKDLRSVIENYLQKKGHLTLLSDRATFDLPDCSAHRHDVCLEEVKKAELMILVIEPRFGAKYYADKNISITWAEFRAACEANIPVIGFIRRPLFDERKCWQRNKQNYNPAHCDDIRIFSFIDEVQQHPRGFWVETAFDHVNDIITKLERTGCVQNSSQFLQPRKQIKLSNFSHDTQEFISMVTHKCQRDDIITKEDLQRCIMKIKENNGKYRDILLYSHMEHDRDDFYYDERIRPAEDDGSSWYCIRQVGAKGKRVFEELSFRICGGKE